MKGMTGLVVGIVALALSGTAGAADEKARGASLQAPDISSSYKVSELSGIDVKNARDESLGTISELLVDKDGKVSHVVLQSGGVAGVGGENYIVPWDRLQLNPGEEVVAVIDVNADAIESEFAAFDESMPTASDKKAAEKSKSSKSEPGKPSSTNP